MRPVPPPIQFAIRGLSPDVLERIDEKFSGEARKGQHSPVQAWLRAQVNISVLPPEIAMHVYTLWQCAQINAVKRGEDIRSAIAISKKQSQEQEEFLLCLKAYLQGDATLPKLVGRLSGIVYYAVYAYAYDGNIERFERDIKAACNMADIPVQVAFHCAAEKMLDRSMRDVKDVASEEEVMQRILVKFGTVRKLLS